MRGLILAGGNGTRLAPITLGTSKQLLPIFDKPTIYYPLSLLMSCGIRDFSIIIRKEHLINFYNLLGDGLKFGIKISYTIQEEAKGISDAFLICEDLIKNDNVCLVLGDNFFHTYEIETYKKAIENFKEGGTIFTYPVNDPSNFGVLDIDKNAKIVGISEKPDNPSSNLAIVGLYLFDKNASIYAKELKPSPRGELEITDLQKKFLEKHILNYIVLDKEKNTWIDTGTIESLFDASLYVKNYQNTHDEILSSPEIIALKNNWISKQQALNINKSKNLYSQNVNKIIETQF